jgi:hypothetical protein
VDRDLTVDLTGVPDIPLLREFSAVLSFLGEEGIRRVTAEDLIGRAKKFVAFAAFRQDPRIRRAADLTPGCIDAYETHLRAQFAGDSTAWYKHLKSTIRLLKEIPDREAAVLSPALRNRLEYTTRDRRPKGKPREPYSPFVARQIREGCKRLMADVRRRMLVEGERLLREGADPSTVPPPPRPPRYPRAEWERKGAWMVPANLVWEAAHHGPLAYTRMADLLGGSVRNISLREVNGYVFPNPEDLFPIYVLLLLHSRIPSTSAENLKEDCLEITDPDGGNGIIRYVKHRAGEKPNKEMTVRAVGSSTPGGIVRTVLRLTHHARRHVEDPTALWIGYWRGNAAANASVLKPRKRKDLNQRFCKEIGLKDDDGRPILLLDLSRLRKTGKAQRYREVKGDIEAFADDHTTQVAYENYANTEALRPTHETAVANAQRTAVRRAEMACTVVLPDEEERLRADGNAASQALGVPVNRALPILRGEQDVFVSACKDIRNSPFAEPGVVCPAGAWGCLTCPNAVVTRRHLPNLIAQLNFFAEQRLRMHEEEWESAFGKSNKAGLAALARFDVTTQLEARAEAETEGRLVYLPVEFIALKKAS